MAIHRAARWAMIACLVVVSTGALSAADLERYRDFQLGSSTAKVAAAAGIDLARTLTTLHRRPALLQELRWRPPVDSDRVAGLDPVRGIVFSFIDDQLFAIAVEYERSRTEGLTHDDMVAAVSAIYGAHGALVSAVRPRAGYAVDAPTAIAQWRNAGTMVALQHYAYTGRYALVLTSVALEQRARQADATAIALDARDAPARDAARLKSEAAAEADAAAKTRATNKEAFEP